MKAENGRKKIASGLDAQDSYAFENLPKYIPCISHLYDTFKKNSVAKVLSFEKGIVSGSCKLYWR